MCACVYVCARFNNLLSSSLLNALYYNRWMLVTSRLMTDYSVLLLAADGLDPACSMRMILLLGY